MAAAAQQEGSPRSDARAGSAHIVVISGPGGAGKSTFISLLCAHALPGALQSSFPVDVAQWPQVMPGSLRKNPPGSRARSRYMLHYDTAGPVRTWGLDYLADPALLDLPKARRVTVADIRASREQLIRQFATRDAVAESKRGVLGRMWNRSMLKFVLQPRKALQRLRLPGKLGLYGQPGWLEGVYARWDAYLEHLGDQTDVRVIRLEPAEGGEGPTFRLAAPEQTGSG